MKNKEIIKCIKTEFIKSNIIRNLILVLIVPLLCIGFTYLFLSRQVADGSIPFSTFRELLFYDYIVYSFIFFPLLKFIFIYKTFGIEYKNRTKRSINVFPIKKHNIFYSKIFIVVFYLLISTLALNLAIYFTKDTFLELMQVQLALPTNEIMLLLELSFGYVIIAVPVIIFFAMLYNFTKNIIITTIGYLVVLLSSFFLIGINQFRYNWLNIFINQYLYILRIEKYSNIIDTEIKYLNRSPEFLIIFSIIVSVGLLVGSKYLLEKYDRVY